MFDTLEVGTSSSQSGDRHNSGDSLHTGRKWRIEPRELRELLPGEAFVSTLYNDGSRMTNPLWKLRVPMPSCDGWQDVPMPAARKHEEGEGLGFWNRYMNPAKLAELHAAAQEAAAAREQVFNAASAEVQEQAKADVEKNPGFVTV